MNKILEVENLTFKYEEDQEAPTLDGVSFAVQGFLSLVKMVQESQPQLVLLTVYLKMYLEI